MRNNFPGNKEEAFGGWRERSLALWMESNVMYLVGVEVGGDEGGGGGKLDWCVFFEEVMDVRSFVFLSIAICPIVKGSYGV